MFAFYSLCFPEMPKLEDSAVVHKPFLDTSAKNRVFPGLWAHVPALLAGDGAKLMEEWQAGLRSPEHQKFLAELAKRAKKRPRS